MKNNKFNKKEIKVNAKISTHSVVYSDNLYPMFYVKLSVCVCMCLRINRENIYTHTRVLVVVPPFTSPPPPV